MGLNAFISEFKDFLNNLDGNIILIGHHCVIRRVIRVQKVDKSLYESYNFRNESIECIYSSKRVLNNEK